MLTELEKAAYKNQMRAMEALAVVRAGAVVAKARSEVLRGTQKNRTQLLGQLEGILGTMGTTVIEQLQLQGLLETGFRQGTETLERASTPSTRGNLPSQIDLLSLGQVQGEAVRRIQGVSEAAKAEIESQVKVSLALGESETQTMARLDSRLTTDRQQSGALKNLRVRTERISRTVSNELVNAGKNQAYTQFAELNQGSVDTLIEWANISDFRSTEICKALNGTKVKPGEVFSWGGQSYPYPPAHPNCRSTVIPVLAKVAPKAPGAAKKPRVVKEPVVINSPPDLAARYPKTAKMRLGPNKNITVNLSPAKGVFKDVAVPGDTMQIGFYVDNWGAIPMLEVSFDAKNTGYEAVKGSPKEKMRAAMATRKALMETISQLPDGRILSNFPLGGKGSARDRIYQRAGFGPVHASGNQYAIVKGGVLQPITRRNVESLVNKSDSES